MGSKGKGLVRNTGIGVKQSSWSGASDSGGMWIPASALQQLLGLSSGKGKGKSKGQSLKSFKPEQRVWIGNLAEGVTWKDLQEHMNQAGKTKWCEVYQNKGKGTGGVAYATAEEASAAIAALNGTMLCTQSIECDVWTKQE